MALSADGEPALFIIVAVAVLIHQLHIDEHRVDVVWFQPLQYCVYCRKHSPEETVKKNYTLAFAMQYTQTKWSKQQQVGVSTKP